MYVDYCPILKIAQLTTRARGAAGISNNARGSRWTGNCLDRGQITKEARDFENTIDLCDSYAVYQNRFLIMFYFLSGQLEVRMNKSKKVPKMFYI